MISRQFVVLACMTAGLMLASSLTEAAPFPEVGPIPPPRPAELNGPDAPAGDIVQPADMPLPVPRPPDLGQIVSLPPPADTPKPPLDSSAMSACASLLASGKVEGATVPPVTGAGGCGIAAPIRLTAILLADGRKIPVEPAALMRCPLAGALADWVRDDIAPLVEKQGSKLARVQDAAAYDCRGRNRIAGAQMSEHGLGNAFDLRALVLADGRNLSIAKSENARPFMEELKKSACTRFRTILGPGSDGYHEDHVHVDLRERRNPKPFCQWTLK